MSQEPNEFEVAPASELQRKHGLYAERRPIARINADDVPTDLRDLIPYAERFGVICDITRHDLGEKTSQEEKDALSAALRGRHARINEWLNSTFPDIPDSWITFDSRKPMLDRRIAEWQASSGNRS